MHPLTRTVYFFPFGKFAAISGCVSTAAERVSKTGIRIQMWRSIGRPNLMTNWVNTAVEQLIFEQCD